MFYSEVPAFEFVNEDTEIIPAEGWKAAVQWARSQKQSYDKLGLLGSSLAGAVHVYGNVTIDLAKFSAAAEPPIIPRSYEEGYIREGFNTMSEALGMVALEEPDEEDVTELPDSETVNQTVDSQLQAALKRQVAGVEALLDDHDASLPPLEELTADLFDTDPPA